MVFYAAFNTISVISRRQLTLFMLSWVSPVLGWALKCLVQELSHEKTQRIQCSSNPGPLDYESNTLPLSHVGPTHMFSNGRDMILHHDNGYDAKAIANTLSFLLKQPSSKWLGLLLKG